MTRTVTVTAYIDLPEGSDQDEAESVVAFALTQDPRIYQLEIESQRTVDLAA